MNVSLQTASQTPISLSTYFPAGTQFFYGYPAGMDSGFLNRVPPSVEELVAVRPICCAGPNVQVISFEATSAPIIDPDLLDRLGLPQLPVEQTIFLPKAIDVDLEGEARNYAIKGALTDLAHEHCLVMAQPYTNVAMADLFQIPPTLTAWLNDKSNMTEYLDAEVMPTRYATYTNGATFATDYQNFPLPVVIKAAASSSGDGVYICQTNEELEAAVQALAELDVTIFVEQYIPVNKNYGVHFGIPHDKAASIDIIGINQQLTTPEGDFLGGIITDTEIPPELQNSLIYLQQTVLPRIRAMGWYGIGCFDVLTDATDHAYFIDCNFRMTGMSAYHFLIANGVLTHPMVSFGGSFTGSSEQLEATLSPYVSHNNNGGNLQLIALSRHGDTWNFNAALSFQDRTKFQDLLNDLLSAGVVSQALEQVSAAAI